MALTENKVIDKIEVIGNGTLQVREATTIMHICTPYGFRYNC